MASYYITHETIVIIIQKLQVKYKTSHDLVQLFVEHGMGDAWQSNKGQIAPYHIFEVKITKTLVDVHIGLKTIAGSQQMVSPLL